MGDSEFALLSIASVERDTGLSKDTLRVWERRYGFPIPLRDRHGERAYPPSQVEKLRTIKRLMDGGLRPGKLMPLPLEQLLTLGESRADSQPPATGANLAPLLDLVRNHGVDSLRHELSQMLMRQGVRNFLLDTLAPLNYAIGDAWIRGELEVFEEHLYTEVVQGVLRTTLAAMPRSGAAPRILLTTLPNESHGLGLLMAEVMFAFDGASCVSLGTQTPTRDILRAAATQAADILALSFSGAYPGNQIAPALGELRARLPDAVEIWTGGSNAGLSRCSAPGIRVMRELGDIAGALADWRAARPGV